LVKKHFSQIKNKNVILPDLGNPFPYPKEYLGKITKFVPIKDKDSLKMIWILPYLQKDL